MLADSSSWAITLHLYTSQHFLGAPFGGIKQSGIGREECFKELLEFTSTKNVNIALG